MQMTSWLPTVSALLGSQSETHKNHKHTLRTTPPLELIPEDEEPHAVSASMFLLHSSPTVLLVIGSHPWISHFQNYGQPLS